MFKNILIAAILFIVGASVTYANGTDSVKEGEKLFERFNCYECHTIVGVGYAVGPILDSFVKEKIKKEGEARYKEWLKKFLIDPQKTKPGTAKPMLKKIPTDEEYSKMFEFMKSV